MTKAKKILDGLKEAFSKEDAIDSMLKKERLVVERDYTWTGSHTLTATADDDKTSEDLIKNIFDYIIDSKLVDKNSMKLDAKRFSIVFKR